MQLQHRAKYSFLLLWDILVWITILFPLFTGGIWIERPHLFIELSQVKGQVAIAGLLALLFFKVFSLPIYEASSVRFLLMIWRKWKNTFKTFPLRTLWMSYFFISFLWAIVAIRRHQAFQSSAADLGIFVSAIWNLTHGYGYISAVKQGMNLFADHQSPIFFLYAPFFKILPYAETLLFLQAFVLCLGGVALFFIGKQYLSDKESFLYALPLIFWCYASVRNANRFDFHPEVTRLPLFLFGIWGVQSLSRNKRIFGIVCLLLALGTKESSAPIGVGICMAWLLGSAPSHAQKFTKKLSFIYLVICLGVFYFDLEIVPHFFHKNYVYINDYSDFHSSLRGILLAPFLNTGLFFKKIFGLTRIHFLWDTIFPLTFFPLLNWRVLIGSIPAYLPIFLTSGDHRVTTGYHYAVSPAVILLWSVPLGYLKIKSYFENKQWNVSILRAVILICAIISLDHSDLFFIRYYKSRKHEQWLRYELIPNLDSNVTIAASGSLVPHITNRHWADHLPRLRIPDGLSQRSWVDCVIYDPLINNWPLLESEIAKIQDGSLLSFYQLEYSCGTLRVWKHPDVKTCLVKMPACDF